MRKIALASLALLFIVICDLSAKRRWIPSITSTPSVVCSGSCWTEVDCSSTGGCSVTSSAQVITVPLGSTGVVKFTSNSGGHTVQYSDNGNPFVSIADGATVTWTTAHTMKIKILSLAAGLDQETVFVTDNVTSATVGTFKGENTHL